VREFAEIAAANLDIKLEWRGVGPEEVGLNTATGKAVIRINSNFYRPAEVDILLADPTKARNQLDWRPEISFEQLVSEMAQADQQVQKRLRR
jgi:GDPmannose 4,6-dehydratase